MPSLFTVHDAAKVRVFAPAATLDALRPPSATLTGRIAPSELVLVGAPGASAALIAHCTTALGTGSETLVIDHTDGWSFFSLVGADAGQVFQRVSMIPLPQPGAAPVFMMGQVCDVAAKTFVRPERIDVMTGMEASDHVAHRFAHAGAAVGLSEVPAPSRDPIGLIV